MKVSSIQQLSYNYGYNFKPVKSKSFCDDKQVSCTPSFCGGNELSNYIEGALYIAQMDKLKKETEQFPQDIEYRSKLLQNAGLNPLNQHKLRSIVGPQEIKTIISRFDNNPEVFSVGENDRNLSNRTMRANLHIHTTASDGSMTVQELLDNAVEYANKVKSEYPDETEPFVVAITDHDTTDGAKDAIKIISEKPLKYKNLRVILGVEMTTFENIAPNIVDIPTNTHILVYGIDPNEARFKNFIDYTKQRKLYIEEKMANSANSVYKKHFGKDNFFSVIGAKEQYNAIDKNIIGIYNGMEKYIETKSVVDQIILKDKNLVKTLKKHNIATYADGFMAELGEFHAAKDGNNKAVRPLQSLPEFIATMTAGLSDNYEKRKNSIEEKITKGMQSPKYTEYSDDLKKTLSEYKVTFTPKYNYMPTFEMLNYNLTEQPNVAIGIAHPIDTVKKIENEQTKYRFLTDLYKRFKTSFNEKAIFSEAYYQSYKPGRKEFNESSKTQKFIKKMSKTLGMLRTGSYDSHGVSVFRRL